ncbi:MAG: flavodoxin domain-containing protein [Chitinophagaceae bacterium]
MNGIIAYKGKYGATKQYAKWLGKDLGLPVYNAAEFPKKGVRLCDFIIIGSSVYIGKLQISQWLKSDVNVLTGKKNFFFQVAGTPLGQKEKLETYIRSGVPKELIPGCDFFYYPGKMAIRELSWTDRFTLKMGARIAKDPAARKAMLTDYNEVKKENIAGLVNAVKNFCAVKKETAQPA